MDVFARYPLDTTLAIFLKRLADYAKRLGPIRTDNGWIGEPTVLHDFGNLYVIRGRYMSDAASPEINLEHAQITPDMVTLELSELTSQRLDVRLLLDELGARLAASEGRPWPYTEYVKSLDAMIRADYPEAGNPADETSAPTETNQQQITVELRSGHTVIGHSDNPVMQALIAGEPLPQVKAREVEEQRMKDWGETPIVVFKDTIKSSCDDLFGDNSKPGVIPLWLANYQQAHPSAFNFNFERTGYLAHIKADDFYRPITCEGSEDKVQGTVHLIVKVDGNSQDSAYFHELYKVARDLGQALGKYLMRRYIRGDEPRIESSADNELQGDDLDVLIRSIQMKGLGRKPESGLEMAAAWLAWKTTPSEKRPKLETWLGEKFGMNNYGVPNLLPTTFHNYKRKVPPKRLSHLKEN